MVEVAARIRRMPLGALLVRAGVASEADVRDALDEGDRTGEKLGQVAFRRGWVSERKLKKMLAGEWGLTAPRPVNLEVDPAALTRLDAALAAELSGDRFDSLRAHLGDVSFVVVPPATFAELLDERKAMFGRTPTPVELVGAWLAATSDTSRVHTGAEGRDTDEAPHDEDNFEEEQSATMEEPYPTVEEHHENGHHPVSSDRIFPASKTGTDSVVDHLRALAGEIEALEHELVDTRQRAEAQENELAELRRARASDLETISGLGAELEQRRGRLDALRAAVGDLSVELDK
jgi:hypothetical protein